MTDDCASNGPASPADTSTTLPPPPALSELIGAQGSREGALFLDFDGTLVEIADHPEQIDIPAGLPAMLAALGERLEGRLAIVSGRSLAALDRFLGPLPVAMAGSHGGEFRPAGSGKVQPLSEPIPSGIVSAMSAFAHDNGGLLVEPKPFSIAVHYRDREDIRPALLETARMLAEPGGLGIKHGKMVVELVMPGSDKGSALSQFMTLAPFAGTRPYFAGDDVTDEDAFRAARRFDGGGILVGAMRDTEALWRIDGVPALRDWFAQECGA
jgi:trehalose 6-phosphate phosphatase